MEDSGFGKGLCYCLGLFLAHAEMANIYKESQQRLGITRWPTIWFNSAGDHMFELEIPGFLTVEVRNRLSDLQSKSLHWRCSGDATEDDVKWAVNEAKELLRAVDEHLAVPTVKATYL